jgi:hypothetical protein
MEHTTIAVDGAKSVFQVAVSSRRGSVDMERPLSRDRFLTFFAQQPPVNVLLEACGRHVRKRSRGRICPATTGQSTASQKGARLTKSHPRGKAQAARYRTR